MGVSVCILYDLFAKQIHTRRRTVTHRSKTHNRAQSQNEEMHWQMQIQLPWHLRIPFLLIIISDWQLCPHQMALPRHLSQIPLVNFCQIEQELPKVVMPNAAKVLGADWLTYAIGVWQCLE